MPYLALKDVNNLKVLNLEGNNITKLESNLEVMFKNELKLVLRNNKIKRLSNGSFKSFQKFTELDLSYNQVDNFTTL